MLCYFTDCKKSVSTNLHGMTRIGFPETSWSHPPWIWRGAFLPCPQNFAATLGAKARSPLALEKALIGPWPYPHSQHKLPVYSIAETSSDFFPVKKSSQPFYCFRLLFKCFPHSCPNKSHEKYSGHKPDQPSKVNQESTNQSPRYTSKRNLPKTHSQLTIVFLHLV